MLVTFPTPLNVNLFWHMMISNLIEVRQLVDHMVVIVEVDDPWPDPLREAGEVPRDLGESIVDHQDGAPVPSMPDATAEGLNKSWSFKTQTHLWYHGNRWNLKKILILEVTFWTKNKTNLKRFLLTQSKIKIGLLDWALETPGFRTTLFRSECLAVRS